MRLDLDWVPTKKNEQEEGFYSMPSGLMTSGSRFCYDIVAPQKLPSTLCTYLLTTYIHTCIACRAVPRLGGATDGRAGYGLRVA